MKNKVFTLSIVLTIALLLAACAGSPTAAPAAEPTAVEAPTAAAAVEATAAEPAAPAANQPEGCLGSPDTALVDLECREVTIAVENAYLPFNYIELKTGEPGGWDYDAWTEICTRLRCTPVFVETGWDGLIQSVADGQTNVGADGLTNTEERQKIVDFSINYLNIEQRLLVRKGETRFASIEELAANPEFTLATQSGTTNYETAVKFLSEDRIQAFEQMPFAVQTLIGGDVDAVLIDAVAGMGYMGENADQLEFVGPSISSDGLGFIFPKGSDLVAPVNQAIEAMQADGTLDEINTRYFGPDFKITSEDIK